VAEKTGVSQTIIAEIKSDTTRRIRKDTERKILSVSIKSAKDGAYIDAKPTWTLIRKLLKEGFTKKELAKRIGLGNSIQLGKERVTAKSAAKVRRFYNLIAYGIGIEAEVFQKRRNFLYVQKPLILNPCPSRDRAA
jgi:hypothetical protein